MLREIISNEIFTILLVLCLVLVAVAKVWFSKRFHDFINVLGNFRYLKVYSRDQKILDTFDTLLFINLLVSSTIFGYLIYTNFIDESTDRHTLLIKLFVGIGLLFLTKILVERLIGILFNVDDYINVYVFQKMSYKNFIGLLLIPINSILLFSISPTPEILQFFVIVLVLINCIALLTSYKTYQSLIKSNLLYFILYICALEITPYLVLYKLFLDYN